MDLLPRKPDGSCLLLAHPSKSSSQYHSRHWEFVQQQVEALSEHLSGLQHSQTLRTNPSRNSGFRMSVQSQASCAHKAFHSLCSIRLGLSLSLIATAHDFKVRYTVKRTSTHQHAEWPWSWGWRSMHKCSPPVYKTAHTHARAHTHTHTHACVLPGLSRLSFFFVLVRLSLS